VLLASLEHQVTDEGAIGAAQVLELDAARARGGE
jgi:hypothetical protein